jgi:4-carboxymuconolactone decarboxylase
VEPVERALRRLALSDEGSLRAALADLRVAGSSDLDAKSQALIRLAALLAVGATTVSLRWTVELAHAAGATDEEVLGVLLAIAPAVGHARIVGVAPDLALALGYDFEEADDAQTVRRRGPPRRSRGPVDTGPAYG